MWFVTCYVHLPDVCLLLGVRRVTDWNKRAYNCRGAVSLEQLVKKFKAYVTRTSVSWIQKVCI